MGQGGAKNQDAPQIPQCLIGEDSCELPAAPTRLIASAAEQSVSLRWKPVAEASSYLVKRKTLAPGVFVDPTTADFEIIYTSSVPQFIDDSVELGSDYLYVVVAVNEIGESPLSQHSCGSPVAVGHLVPDVRPRVFMSMHGSNTLALGDEEMDAAWAYVRTCLDGIWGNYAGVPEDTRASLWQKLNTRNVFHVVNFTGTGGAPFQEADRDIWTSMEARGINLNREAMMVYTLDPAHWSSRSIAEARAFYQRGVNRDAPDWMLYDEIYTGWALRNWRDPADPDLGVYSTPDSILAFDSADGAFMECIGGLCAGGKDRAAAEEMVRATRARDQKLLMFLSLNQTDPEAEGKTEGFKKIYAWMTEEALWREGDIVMHINYRESYRALPMIDSNQSGDSSTGFLHWALHQ